tara:strand:+ start:3017 stop:3532 length:516 start_codon:yes stop_codon:yes gene_type:complete
MVSYSIHGCVAIAKLLRPHGIDGKLKLESYTQPLDAIINYPTWLDQNMQIISVVSIQQAGKRFIVSLTGVENREQAANLTHTVIYTPKAQLPTLQTNEYYWHELEGLTVTNHLQQTLGVVSYVMDGPQNDLLVVTDKKNKDILIPYEKDVILKIDTKAGFMHVYWEHPDDL